MPAKRNIVVATIKSWNLTNFQKLRERRPDYNLSLLTDQVDLNPATLEPLSPDFVFFPHWSWIIRPEVYHHFNCIAFHMTDLPFGRGGSPLQNLIARGIYQTKISAFKVGKGMDTGDIYLKKPFDISEGSADQMFTRFSPIAFSMIEEIVDNGLTPAQQVGEPVCFARRTPEQSKIPDGLTPRQLYDHVRMLDGEGYPRAYTEQGGFRHTYSNARLEGDTVKCDVEVKPTLTHA